MSTPPYQYDRRHSTRYTFISKGRVGAIVKVVEFTPTTAKNILNLGFGDLLADGTIDDIAKTNNNDIVRVLATVIDIIKDFTTDYPWVKIVFSGSNAIRTSLYHRILKMYYQNFIINFTITALIKEGNGFAEVGFDPSGSAKYFAFLIKRKL